jgi:RHS repeat-associated protein
VNAAGYRTETAGTLDGASETLSTTYDPAFPVERLTAVTLNGITKPIVYDAWDSVATDQHGHRFSYTPSGELASATVASTTRRYFRDGAGVPWGERAGTTMRLVTWDLDAADRPLQVDDPVAGIFAYAEIDGLLAGRIDYPRAALQSQSANASGTLLAEGANGRSKGSAFGAGIASASARGERMLYAGLEAVPGNTSLHLARRRAYDAQTGRFLALDPLGLGGGLHRSLYASGDPVNRRDPLGLSDCGGGGLPDFDFESIDEIPPAIIEGPEGGPATPFGPGVPVSYVNQAAGDKTFQEKMDKWYSDYLVAMNAGIFSGADNPPDDTDASRGNNASSGRAGRGRNRGLFGAAAMDVAIEWPMPPPTPPEPGPPGPPSPPTIGDPTSSGEDLHQDSRATAPDSPPPLGPPVIAHFVEVDAYNRSPIQRLKQLLDALVDSQEDPLRQLKDEPKPPSGEPVKLDGYFLRYAFDPTAYAGRVQPETSPQIDPGEIQGRSLEDALAEKWSAEASTPSDLVEQQTQEPPPLDVFINMLLLMGLPPTGPGQFVDDVVRIGANKVDDLVRVSASKADDLTRVGANHVDDAASAARTPPPRGETRFVGNVTVTPRGGPAMSGTVDLKPTLDRIRSGGGFPHRNDGSVFRNREGLLPQQPGGYYTEFVHPTPGVNGPGPQRVITGQGGELYYTPDHYGTFIPLN